MSVEMIDIEMRRAMRDVEPRSRHELRGWLRAVLGIEAPARSRFDGHDAPLDYLEHVFLRGGGDVVVWASRGGGKTFLGAVATLLELLFRPGIEVRVLGGSFEQSAKMHRYLRRFLEGDVFGDLIDGKVTNRGARLVNGSCVELLTQSERSVRGQRIHRLRCDEVELFDPAIWEAAQLVTRSGWCGGRWVRSSVEAFSTMHRPMGLMHRLVEGATRGVHNAADDGSDVDDGSSAHGVRRPRLFRWNAIDVLERCESERLCERCPLNDSCAGRAKDGDRLRDGGGRGGSGGLSRTMGSGGFLRIDDAIEQRARVRPETWTAEMLCEGASRTDAVYPEFNPAVHVRPFDADSRGADSARADAPGDGDGDAWRCGMDLGYRSPTVVLWAHHDRERDVLHIVDELIVTERTTAEVIELAKARPWPGPRWIAADPAGEQRSEQTGTSALSLWREAGFSVRTRRQGIQPGVAAVARRLRAADGRVRLLIDPRCEGLIRSLTGYRYPDDQPEAELPVKDGHDHAADALRYLVTALDGAAMLAGQGRGY